MFVCAVFYVCIYTVIVFLKRLHDVDMTFIPVIIFVIIVIITVIIVTIMNERISE